MAPPRHHAPPTDQQQAAAAAAAAAAAVRLPDFHADSPQCWFTNLDSQFATANITQSITKFHWAVAKLPFSLTPTIQPLGDDPTARRRPVRETEGAPPGILRHDRGTANQQVA